MARCGIVWISPAAPVPKGRLADPSSPMFGASWQEDEHLLGFSQEMTAEAAIAWSRRRAARILIRLGDSPDSYLSAGDQPERGLPRWPPDGPPAGGWWSAADTPSEEVSASGRWSVAFGLELQGERELGDAAERAFTASIAGDVGVESVTGTERMARGSIRVTATVLARTRTEAEARGREIRKAARAAAVSEIPDWSTAAWSSSSRVEGPIAESS